MEQFGKTLLKIGDAASPEVFTTILDVEPLSPPGINAETEDVTTHSDADAWRRFAATLLDLGEVSFDILWDPANTQHALLQTSAIARTTKNFQLVFPSSPAVTWAFAAIITGFMPQTPIDEHLKASVTLKGTGAPTIT